ncbi:MAG: hypothetical protein IT236_17250 [Bacteroidia bacterium]|nr:hypothetical protein [Bacteroidia bacterium]
MRFFKSFLILGLMVVCLPIVAQTPTFDELTFEDEELTVAYKNKPKNHVFLRSKRGTNGMNKTSSGDSITAMPVNEIVLVFSELEASAADEREEANRERWENLLMTYPEYFQANTSYKNVCQCNTSGDAEQFKKMQGFYIYFTGKEPKVEEKRAEVKPVKTEEKTAPVKETKEPEKQAVAKTKEPAVKESEPVKNDPPPAKETREENTNSGGNEVVKENTTTTKKPATAKPRRSKDTKACRLPCYENGDEDLNAFFRTSITLTKKQKKHGKHLEATVKIPLHFDGSIKKPMVVGENEDLNKQILEALKSMINWNAAVKNGVATKSEVKITLKFDKETKSMKPAEIIITPKLGPKCTCVSDAEIFGE